MNLVFFVYFTLKRYQIELNKSLKSFFISLPQAVELFVTTANFLLTNY